ncbi:MAG TPA: tetratricopeptide repeat protein, partial [Gemmataceae bacterium]|nr:tetratricopeptide repeat protein [Gemmataceae bacterium]
PVKAIDAALAEATAMKAAQARLQARTPEEAGKALDQLIQGKKDADDKVVKLTDDLKKAEKDIADAKKATDTALEMVKDRDKKLQAANDLLKAADARLKAIADNLGVKQADVVKGVQQLGDACNKANASLDAVARKLKADKYLDADADRSKVPEGVDRALMVAREKDPAGRIAAAEREAQRARAVAAQRWTPQQMLDVWLPVVQTQPAGVNTKRSLQDAARVLADKDAPREAKAKAQAVRGFVLRKEGKHAEARKALEEALKDDKAPVGWRADARRTLDALSDPAAWYLPTAEGYYASGHNAEALKVLDEALQVFPKDNARLLALRSLVRLAQASDKARGNPTADDPAVKAALQDAQAAIDGGAKPEGLYAAGRIAEEVGDLAGARKAYEAALAAHPEADLSGNRYRVALARVLLKQERAKAGEGRVGRLPAGGAARLLAALKDGDPADSLAALALLVTLAVPPDGLPTPEQQKANELANEVLKSRPAPGDFLLRAQAHALQGEWTKALKVYVEGLRPHLRRDYADGLAEIINNHPVFKRPDSRSVPNPLLAEQHWGAGLRAYYARRWADAEREFGEAIANDSQDARYFYFLGLSRLQQGRRADAIADFEEGYRLEELGKPSRTAVNASLERVQGPMRRTLDRYRETSK